MRLSFGSCVLDPETRELRREEAFNVWNWHNFTASGARGQVAGNIVDTDLASPDFGKWTGIVTSPRVVQRVVQLAARLEF